MLLIMFEPDEDAVILIKTGHVMHVMQVSEGWINDHDPSRPK